MWIVDVKGKLLFLEAETSPSEIQYAVSVGEITSQDAEQASLRLEQEIQKIIESIRFE